MDYFVRNADGVRFDRPKEMKVIIDRRFNELRGTIVFEDDKNRRQENLAEAAVKWWSADYDASSNSRKQREEAWQKAQRINKLFEVLTRKDLIDNFIRATVQRPDTASSTKYQGSEVPIIGSDWFLDCFHSTYKSAGFTGSDEVFARQILINCFGTFAMLKGVNENYVELEAYKELCPTKYELQADFLKTRLLSRIQEMPVIEAKGKRNSDLFSPVKHWLIEFKRHMVHELSISNSIKRVVDTIGHALDVKSVLTERLHNNQPFNNLMGIYNFIEWGLEAAAGNEFGTLPDFEESVNITDDAKQLEEYFANADARYKLENIEDVAGCLEIVRYQQPTDKRMRMISIFYRLRQDVQFETDLWEIHDSKNDDYYSYRPADDGLDVIKTVSNAFPPHKIDAMIHKIASNAIDFASNDTDPPLVVGLDLDERWIRFACMSMCNYYEIVYDGGVNGRISSKYRYRFNVSYDPAVYVPHSADFVTQVDDLSFETDTVRNVLTFGKLPDQSAESWFELKNQTASPFFDTNYVSSGNVTEVDFSSTRDMKANIYPSDEDVNRPEPMTFRVNLMEIGLESYYTDKFLAKNFFLPDYLSQRMTALKAVFDEFSSKDYDIPAYTLERLLWHEFYELMRPIFESRAVENLTRNLMRREGIFYVYGRRTFNNENTAVLSWMISRMLLEISQQYNPNDLEWLFEALTAEVRVSAQNLFSKDKQAEISAMSRPIGG